MIRSIWQVKGSPSFQQEQIIPKGIIEVIFNFSGSDPIAAYIGSRQYHLSNCFINGFNTEPVMIHLPKQQEFFGVQFQPLAVKKIFKIPAGEFANSNIDLALINSNFHSLWHQLAGQDDFDRRVIIFLEWIKTISFNWQPQEKLMNDFIYSDHEHDMPVKELASSLCYSPRHLSRKLFEATGMNTESVLLYKKYLHAVDLVHQTDLSLTEIAYHSNFSDQSHFIKTFKAYTKITPGEYKRNKSYVKGHLFENVR